MARITVAVRIGLVLAAAAFLVTIGIVAAMPGRGDNLTVGEWQVISTPQGRILYDTETGMISVLVKGVIEHPQQIEFV